MEVLIDKLTTEFDTLNISKPHLWPKHTEKRKMLLSNEFHEERKVVNSSDLNKEQELCFKRIVQNVDHKSVINIKD